MSQETPLLDVVTSVASQNSSWNLDNGQQTSTQLITGALPEPSSKHEPFPTYFQPQGMFGVMFVDGMVCPEFQPGKQYRIQISELEPPPADPVPAPTEQPAG